MSQGYRPRGIAGRFGGIAFVVALHLLLAWALIIGTTRKGLAVLKKPLEAVVIQEVIIPPPPPPPPPPPKEITPPPKTPIVEAPPPPFVPPPEIAPPPAPAAPVIVAAAAPPPTPPVIAPPPAPAPPGPAPAPAPPPPAPAKGPSRSDIGIACPSQVPPEMPRKALQDGTAGVVRAQALIKDGVVKEVTVLSGPRVFHAAVRAAMLQYKCTQDAAEVLATQEFNFKLE